LRAIVRFMQFSLDMRYNGERRCIGRKPKRRGVTEQ